MDEKLKDRLEETDETVLWNVLKQIKKDERKTKLRTKTQVAFPRTTVYVQGERKPIVSTSVTEIVKFLTGVLISDITSRSNANIKSGFVEAVEWLAELSDSLADRNQLRNYAAKIIVIDDRDHLISKILSFATSLKD